MRIAVIGAGSWGTALAQMLALGGHEVALWARRDAVADAINTQHRNPRYLSDAQLSERIHATSSFEEALAQAEAAVIVTPSAVLRETAAAIKPFVSEALPVIICSKGVEAQSGKLPTEVFEEEIGNRDRLAVLSGPNHAEEVVRSMFSATVIASSNPQTAQFFQHAFASDTFRTYVSDDVCGVELCSAFKNVIAIAVGFSYGLQYGDNTAAVLMTRGLAEMSRLISACGGRPLTCMGLAGAGDLIATCTSEHSRNRRLGFMLAQGGTLDDFTEATHMVAEGALACRALGTLGERYEVELPITDVVRGVVWGGLTAERAIAELASRPLTTEFYGL